jgi:hypothetical protein
MCVKVQQHMRRQHTDRRRTNTQTQADTILVYHVHAAARKLTTTHQSPHINVLLQAEK